MCQRSLSQVVFGALHSQCDNFHYSPASVVSRKQQVLSWLIQQVHRGNKIIQPESNREAMEKIVH